MSASDIVIYSPDDGHLGEGSPEERALVEVLTELRDDPTLLACIAEDAKYFIQGKRRVNPAHPNYVKDVERIARLATRAMDA